MAETSKKKAGSKRSPQSESNPPSEPLPSQVPGTSSGASIYVMGALLFAAAIAVLLYMRCQGEPKPEPTASVVPTANEVPADVPKFAPPPPPEEEEDAGAEDAKTAEPSTEPKAKVAPGPGGGGSCSKCGEGTPSGALQSEVSKTGGLARGCYNRTLREGAAEGAIMVSVSVGADGNLCGARITSDSVGNPALSQCVLSKFQSRSYPKPERGCVVLNVPISFSMKK